MREVAVAGVGMTRFDSYDGEKGHLYKDYWDLGGEAVLRALEDADMEFRDMPVNFGKHL